jgi:putative membrane protein
LIDSNDQFEHGSRVLRIALAGLHLLALSLGMMAVVLRGSALREAPTAGSLRRAFRLDTIWGIAAALWLVTGLWRLLGHVEKPTAYYFDNRWFLVKMGLFILIVLLEIGPMMTLIRWRKAFRGGAAPASFVTQAAGKRFAIIGHIQATLALLMIFAAVAMARGYG